MVTWPVCALVVGLALVFALWDGLRRYASARGIEQRVLATLDERLKTHQIALDKLETATNAYVAQTTNEIRSLAQAQGLRAMRTG